MTVEQIVFIIVSLITIVSAIFVVTMRNLFHAALFMMLSFLGVAGIYVTLDAGFMAAAQLLVYIGAISILIIFAIMLTRQMMQTEEKPFFNSQVGLGLITALATLVVISFTLMRFWGNPDLQNVFGQKPDAPPLVFANMITKLGESLVDPNLYVLPFLVASMLLLAALIGSVYIAWPRQQIGGMEEEL